MKVLIRNEIEKLRELSVKVSKTGIREIMPGIGNGE